MKILNPNPDSTIEFIAPSEQFALENEDRNINDSNIHPRRVSQDRNSEYSFIIKEEHTEQYLSVDILDNVKDVESDDRVKF